MKTFVLLNVMGVGFYWLYLLNLPAIYISRSTNAIRTWCSVDLLAILFSMRHHGGACSVPYFAPESCYWSKMGVSAYRGPLDLASGEEQETDFCFTCKSWDNEKNCLQPDQNLRAILNLLMHWATTKKQNNILDPKSSAPEHKPGFLSKESYFEAQFRL